MGNGDAGSAGGSGSGRDFGRGVGGSVRAAVGGEGATDAFDEYYRAQTQDGFVHNDRLQLHHC